MENQVVKQAILVEGSNFDTNQNPDLIALFEADGTPITSVASTPVGSDILLTGLVAGTADPVVATDNVNEAVAKLQATLAAVPFPAVVTATAIGTAGKTTTSDEPAANTIVPVKFTNGNSAASPTVAFNGGAARSILLGGTAPTGAEATVAAGGVIVCWFDGTALHQFGVHA
jgi:hypothetical protein